MGTDEERPGTVRHRIPGRPAVCSTDVEVGAEVASGLAKSRSKLYRWSQDEIHAGTWKQLVDCPGSGLGGNGQRGRPATQSADRFLKGGEPAHEESVRQCASQRLRDERETERVWKSRVYAARQAPLHRSIRERLCTPGPNAAYWLRLAMSLKSNSTRLIAGMPFLGLIIDWGIDDPETTFDTIKECDGGPRRATNRFGC